MCVDYLTNGSDSLNSIDIDILKHLVDSLRLVLKLIDECSQELDEIRIIVIDTEVEAIEQCHLVFFDVVGMLVDNIDDLKV